MTEATRYFIGIKGFWGWKRIEVSTYHLQTRVNGDEIPTRLIYQTPDGHVVSIPDIDSKTWCVYPEYWDAIKAYAEAVKTKVDEEATVLKSRFDEFVVEQQAKLQVVEERLGIVSAERDIFAAKAEESTQRYEQLVAKVQKAEEEAAENFQRLQDEYQQFRGAQGWQPTADQRNI